MSLKNKQKKIHYGIINTCIFFPTIMIIACLLSARANAETKNQFNDLTDNAFQKTSLYLVSNMEIMKYQDIVMHLTADKTKEKIYNTSLTNKSQQYNDKAIKALIKKWIAKLKRIWDKYSRMLS